MAPDVPRVHRGHQQPAGRPKPSESCGAERLYGGAVSNISQARAFAEQLRDLGCRFALDDFGAGFGSFYYLKHLPFDYVKIDGEFVQHAVTGQIDQLVITAIVGIAQGLGEETIAESVTGEKTKRWCGGSASTTPRDTTSASPFSATSCSSSPTRTSARKRGRGPQERFA